MDWEVVWTEIATADLEEAVRAAAQHGADVAEALRADLLAHVAVLARFPLIGPQYERDRTGRTREILCRRYRIFYRVAEEARRVEVLAVWHSARREPRLRDLGGQSQN